MTDKVGTKGARGTKKEEVAVDKAQTVVIEGKKEEKGVELTMEQKITMVKMDEKLSKSAKMKGMYDLGMQIKDIAAELGVRYNFVYNVISNYCIVSGIELTKSTKETKKDKVWALFDQGKTVKEVAIDLKTNYQYVYKLHKEWKDQAVKEVQASEQSSIVKAEGATEGAEDPKTTEGAELAATGTEGGAK